ncbi:glycosyltransferase [Agrococcus terreus]|uniref:glycosyltransferase n=1 Tax=Agrococcus terreus TaxID=574649 RepID=UPI0031DC8698
MSSHGPARDDAADIPFDHHGVAPKVSASSHGSGALGLVDRDAGPATRVSVLEERLQRAEGRLQRSAERLQRSEERLQQARAGLERMRSLRDAAASRGAQAREQLTALQASARETVAQLRAEKASLREQVRQQHASSSSLLAENKALRKEVAASAAGVGALEGRLQRSEERLQQARAGLERMRSLRDAAASRGAQAREQLNALQASARETVAQLRAEKDSLREQVRQEHASSSSLLAENKALRKEVAASAAGVGALEGRLQRSEERLQQARAGLERMRSSRDAAASRGAQAREQLTALQASARETVAQLKAELVAVRERARAEQAEMREQVQAAKASSSSLAVELVAMRKEMAALTKQRSALEGRVERSEGQREQVRVALEKMRVQRDAVASRHALVREELTALQTSTREAAARWKAEAAELRAQVRAEKASSSSLLAANTKLKKGAAAAATRIGALETKVQHSEERSQQTRDALKKSRDGAAEKQGVLVERLAVSRERIASLGSLWTSARRYAALYRQGLLYDEISNADIDLSADTYLCLLPSTVPAAMTLNRMHGGGARIICDAVENVEVHKHSLAPNLHPPTLDLVNLGAYGALTQVDGIMTVSNSVAKTLSRFGPPVRLQPNYRRYEEPAPAGGLRRRLGLDAESTLLVTTGNVVKGFDTVIDALALLPPTVHLVAFVKMSPPPYEASMRAYIESRGLSGRVHVLGFVPYDELAGVLSEADLGLITLDPENPNHSVSLPNRVFDFTTAGLPFVVPPLAEISALVEQHRCGAVIPEVSAEAWATTIREVLLNISDYRDAMRIARKKLTWESHDDGLIEFLGNPKSVTLLGFRDLSRYQRFLRVTDSLTQRGIHVKAAFFSEDPLPLKNKDAEFYYFSDRYGKSPGLKRVPSVGA